MPSSDERRLLDEVLRDENYAAFRAETYELSRAEFNRGREHSMKPVLLAIAAVIVVSTALVLTVVAGKKQVASPEVARKNPASGVESPELAIVQTTPLEPAQMLRSVLDRSVMVETKRTGNSGIQLVQSNPSSVVGIRDAELIALFGNDSIGFLRSGERLSLYFAPN